MILNQLATEDADDDDDIGYGAAAVDMFIFDMIMPLA